MQIQSSPLSPVHKSFFAKALLVFFCCTALNPFGGGARSLGRLGAPNDTLTPFQPAYLLMGGSTDVDAAVTNWLAHAKGGDIVVLRASGGTGYNAYFLEKGKAHSVETLLLDSKESAQDPAMAAVIEKAEAIFIAGGDQWNYIRFWTNTAVQTALQKAIDKGVPIGGTSAGLAVMGEFVFDAQFNSVTSAEALTQPQGEKISIAHHFLNIPVLKNMLTDSHYSQRDRMGRHWIFLLRAKALYGKRPKGIGVDEKTALVLQPDGSGSIFGSAKVFFLCKAKKKQVQFLAMNGSQMGTPVQLNQVFGLAKERYTTPVNMGPKQAR